MEVILKWWRAIYQFFGETFRWSTPLTNPKLPSLMKTLEDAQRDWNYVKTYFNIVTDPDLVDHAIFNLGAAEKKYIYLLKQARESGFNTDRFHLG